MQKMKPFYYQGLTHESFLAALHFGTECFSDRYLVSESLLILIEMFIPTGTTGMEAGQGSEELLSDLIR